MQEDMWTRYTASLRGYYPVQVPRVLSQAIILLVVADYSGPVSVNSKLLEDPTPSE